MQTSHKTTQLKHGLINIIADAELFKSLNHQHQLAIN